jgi:hypothetical protein
VGQVGLELIRTEVSDTGRTDVGQESFQVTLLLLDMPNRLPVPGAMSHVLANVISERATPFRGEPIVGVVDDAVAAQGSVGDVLSEDPLSGGSICRARGSLTTAPDLVVPARDPRPHALALVERPRSAAPFSSALAHRFSSGATLGRVIGVASTLSRHVDKTTPGLATSRGS